MGIRNVELVMEKELLNASIKEGLAPLVMALRNAELVRELDSYINKIK